MLQHLPINVSVHAVIVKSFPVIVRFHPVFVRGHPVLVRIFPAFDETHPVVTQFHLYPEQPLPVASDNSRRVEVAIRTVMTTIRFMGEQYILRRKGAQSRDHVYFQKSIGVSGRHALKTKRPSL